VKINIIKHGMIRIINKKLLSIISDVKYKKVQFIQKLVNKLDYKTKEEDCFEKNKHKKYKVYNSNNCIDNSYSISYKSLFGFD
jgi:hypothetical protein